MGADPVDRDFGDSDVDHRTGGGVEAEAVDSPPLILMTYQVILMTYQDFPFTLASRTLPARQVAHLYNNLSIGACFDKCGLTDGRRRIHGYSNNELAFHPEGSRRKMFEPYVQAHAKYRYPSNFNSTPRMRSALRRPNSATNLPEHPIIWAGVIPARAPCGWWGCRGGFELGHEFRSAVDADGLTAKAARKTTYALCSDRCDLAICLSPSI